MTFELTQTTKAKLADVVVLSQKNRNPDDNPGAQLAFSVLLPNTDLAMFDGGMRSALYTKNANSSPAPQGELEGVPVVSDTPNLTSLGLGFGKMHWQREKEWTGYELEFDQGIGGKSNLIIKDCVLSKFRIDPKEGGTVGVDFIVESPDVSPETFGKLATLKNRDVHIMLTAPEPVQDGIE